MGKFDGKVAVVTGGSRDIGASISLKLAAEGAKVVVNYNSSEAGANAVVEEIKANGGEAIAVKANISKLSEIAHLKDMLRRLYENMERLEPAVVKA